jgi:Transposase IS66 family
VYATDRKAKQPIAHLAAFAGILQVDGYGGYRALAERNDVLLAFCRSHVRRRKIEGNTVLEDRFAPPLDLASRVRHQEQRLPSKPLPGPQSCDENLSAGCSGRTLDAALPLPSRGDGEWTGQGVLT